MKLLFKGIIILGCLIMLWHMVGFIPARKSDKLRVLLIVGGHEFNESAFFTMMKSLPGVSYDLVSHPYVYARFTEDNLKRYDVLLFYDMPRTITPENKNAFEQMLKRGKGVVFLHHALCRYQEGWSDFVRVAGGYYHERKWTKDGVEMPASAYKHDVSFKVKVADKSHSITDGIADFDIIDETYARMDFLPGIEPLLISDEPTGSGYVAWTNQYEQSKIVSIALGHDEQAWQNPSFVRLLSQSIQWAK